MKKLLLAVVCLFMLVPAVLAQGRAEVFVGYSNLQAEGVPNPNRPGQVFSGDFFDRRRGAHGIDASVTGYLNSNFGVKGDFSFNQNDDRTNLAGGGIDSVKHRVFYFMGGPTIKFRNRGRVEPFAHALVGGAHTRFNVETSFTLPGGVIRDTFETSATDFAAAVGGGVDVRFGEKMSIRLFQFDYAPIFLKDRSISRLGSAGAIVPFTLEGKRQDNIRLSVGVVF